MADDSGSIIIKRVKKGGHGGHGGAWKIAYADFVTAMMAFFLLLWLLNSVTQEQLEGISNYFAPASLSPTTSGSGGVLGGQTISEEGAEQSARAKPTVTLDLPPPKAGLGGQDFRDEAKDNPTDNQADDVASDAALRNAEEKQFEEAKQELQKAIEGIPESAQLRDSLIVDNTPEGLRIQIVDQEGRPMFPSGSAEPLEPAKKILLLVNDVISKMPQSIAITGHTDAVPFGAGSQYTNWELSVDRANAARRYLRDLGLPIARLSRVVGKADTEPLIKDDPKNARNRRLSIVLLRGTGLGEGTAREEAPN
jgi:chemotaxis protein MotB